MTNSAKPPFLGIGELSRQTKVGVETIRYFEKIGFSQKEIKALLFMVDAKGVTCAEVHSITTEHIADIRKKILDLRKMEKVLTQMANECSRGDIPDCPIIETLFAAEA